MNEETLLATFAAASENPDWPWVCRHSTTGRGLRLYQTNPDWIYQAPELRMFDQAYATPIEALKAFIDKVMLS